MLFRTTKGTVQTLEHSALTRVGTWFIANIPQQQAIASFASSSIRIDIINVHRYIYIYICIYVYIHMYIYIHIYIYI